MKAKTLILVFSAALIFLTFGCSKKAHYDNFYHEGRSYIRPHHQSVTCW